MNNIQLKQKMNAHQSKKKKILKTFKDSKDFQRC